MQEVRAAHCLLSQLFGVYSIRILTYFLSMQRRLFVYIKNNNKYLRVLQNRNLFKSFLFEFHQNYIISQG